MSHSASDPSKKWLIPTLSILALIIVILFALGILGSGDQVEPGQTQLNSTTLPPSSQTYTVTKQSAANYISWPGTFRSRIEAQIAPKLNTRILEIKVNAGDRVKKGDVIAILDDREYRAAYNRSIAALNAAKARAEQALADAQRIRELYRLEATTRENYDAVIARSQTSKAQVKEAASSVEQSRVNLGDNHLKAPFAGLISSRLKEPGDMGSPSQPIVILIKENDLRFETALPIDCVKRLKLNEEVSIRTESPSQSWRGVISEIIPSVDPETRTQSIKADVKNSDGLEHGQFGWMDIECSDERESIFVPASAIRRYGQLETVQIVENGNIHTRHVRSGKTVDGKIEILSGLHDGETILLNNGLSK